MKKALAATSLMLFMLSPVAIVQGQSNSTKGDALTDEANRLMAELKDILGKLSLVDETDKTLAQEARRLKDTDDLLKGAKARLETEGAQLEMDGDEWDRKRQRAVDSGCPSTSGTTTNRALAARCNPLVDQLNAEHNQIMDRLQTFKQKADDQAQARQNLSVATLEWSKKKKANDARREDLTQSRSRIEARLLELQGKADSCGKLLKKSGGVTCEKLKHACGNIQFDGSDPNLPPSKKDSLCGKS